MSLGGFFKKVTGVARALGNPGGTAINVLRGQPAVDTSGKLNFAQNADPLNAVHATQMPGAAPVGQTPYQPQYNWAAPTMSRQAMVAAALANHGAQYPGGQPLAPPMAPPGAPPGAPPAAPNFAPTPGGGIRPIMAVGGAPSPLASAIGAAPGMPAPMQNQLAPGGTVNFNAPKPMPMQPGARYASAMMM